MAEVRNLVGTFFCFVLYGLVLPGCFSADVQECGLRNVVNINGSEINDRYLEYPWHIFLYRQINSDEPPEYICGGSIVHPKLIVTAAHCVYDETKFAITKAKLIVAAGKYNRSWDYTGSAEQRFYVGEIKIPETYIGFPGKYRDDIAILILSESINVSKFVMPICIDWNSKGELVLTNGSVVGWELTENGTLSTKPVVARTEYYNFTACRKIVSKKFLGFVSSDKFCGVPSSSAISTRRSDGSGFVILLNLTKNYEKYYLQGIVSAKDRESNLTSYTDINKHLKWLHSILTSVLILETPEFTLDYGDDFRECGIRYAVNSQIPTIVYGFEARPSEFPWHVAIFRQFNLTEQPEYICGGSIVHRKLILTAAHCFYSNEDFTLINATYTVIAGKYYRSWEHRDALEQRFEVMQIMIPETYQSFLNRYADDLAILVTNETIRFSSIIMPICINWKPDVKVEISSEMGTVVGWGLTEKSSLSETLLVAKIKYYNFTACINHLNNEGFSSFVTSDKFCAFLGNGTTVDQGDSGGGLVFPIDSARNKHQFFLRGIVSTKDSTGTNVAAFTDISKHMVWLNSRMSPFIDAEYCPVLSSSQVELDDCTINSTAVACDKPATVGTTAKVLCRGSFHAGFPFRLYTKTECMNNHTWSPLMKICIDCGKRYSFNDFVPAIINGPSTKKSEFPWHVHIYIQNGAEYKYICGGTIIHPKAVLTAAQHFFNEPQLKVTDPKLIYIAIGNYDSDWDTEVSFVQKFQASKIFMKNTYIGLDNDYADNIAILELNGTIILSDYIMPACIDWTGKLQLPKKPYLSAQILGKRSSVLDLVRCHSLMFEAERNSTSLLTSDKWCGVAEGQRLPASSSGVSVTFTGYNEGGNREYIYYVYGVVSNQTRKHNIIVVTDVLYHIEWIKDIMISITKSK